MITESSQKDSRKRKVFRRWNSCIILTTVQLIELKGFLESFLTITFTTVAKNAAAVANGFLSDRVPLGVVVVLQGCGNQKNDQDGHQDEHWGDEDTPSRVMKGGGARTKFLGDFAFQMLQE